MKIIHLSDLHVGKRVNGFSLIEDQRYILDRIAEISEEEKPDVIIIAGDVYDKPQPSGEAVTVFDSFITKLSKLRNCRDEKTMILIISGNHDSGERLAFGQDIFREEGITISGTYDGRLKTVRLEDDFGTVSFTLLPFIKPANVRSVTGDEVSTYTEAVEAALKGAEINEGERTVLVAHQFVTGGITSESEEYSVGGLDNVDGSVFDSFDYVALGHLHGPQKMGRETLRYGGSPLKYSFSEVNQNKSVTVVELFEKGKTDIRLIPLKPLRDMREIEGTYESLMGPEGRTTGSTEDYIKAVLTDEEGIPYVMGKLRSVYPNIMEVAYINLKKQGGTVAAANDFTGIKEDPIDVFCEFYRQQNNREIDSEKKEYIRGLIEEVWEEEA